MDRVGTTLSLFGLFVAFCGYPQRSSPLERLALVDRETVSTTSES